MNCQRNEISKGGLNSEIGTNNKFFSVTKSFEKKIQVYTADCYKNDSQSDCNNVPVTRRYVLLHLKPSIYHLARADTGIFLSLSPGGRLNTRVRKGWQRGSSRDFNPYLLPFLAHTIKGEERRKYEFSRIRVWVAAISTTKRKHSSASRRVA